MHFHWNSNWVVKIIFLSFLIFLFVIIIFFFLCLFILWIYYICFNFHLLFLFTWLITDLLHRMYHGDRPKCTFLKRLGPKVKFSRLFIHFAWLITSYSNLERANYGDGIWGFWQFKRSAITFKNYTNLLYFQIWIMHIFLRFIGFKDIHTFQNITQSYLISKFEWRIPPWNLNNTYLSKIYNDFK